jgi:uncharacterized protein
MKRRWVIVVLTCVALISVGLILRGEQKNRRLAKQAAAYRILAEQGDPKYQSMMGYVYEYGKGVPKDYVEAVRWYPKAAEQGDAYGQYALAQMYHEGKGISQDDLKAAQWCRNSCRRRQCSGAGRSRNHVSPRRRGGSGRRRGCPLVS